MLCSEIDTRWTKVGLKAEGSLRCRFSQWQGRQALAEQMDGGPLPLRTETLAVTSVSRPAPPTILHHQPLSVISSNNTAPSRLN